MCRVILVILVIRILQVMQVQKIRKTHKRSEEPMTYMSTSKLMKSKSLKQTMLRNIKHAIGYPYNPGCFGMQQCFHTCGHQSVKSNCSMLCPDERYHYGTVIHSTSHPTQLRSYSKGNATLKLVVVSDVTELAIVGSKNTMHHSVL